MQINPRFTKIIYTINRLKGTDWFFHLENTDSDLTLTSAEKQNWQDFMALINTGAQI